MLPTLDTSEPVSHWHFPVLPHNREDVLSEDVLSSKRVFETPLDRLEEALAAAGTMAAPPSRGKLDGNAARPPLRLTSEGGRPGSSPRVMLQPLQPPNSQGFAGGTTASADDKEYLAMMKREIRVLAAKVAEYSAAVDTDRRMSDSSTLLRRPLTPGSANRPGTSGGLTAVGQIAGNVDTYIEKASAGKGFEQAKSGLLELLLTLLEDAQRCTLMLTEKRAPAGCTVPAPSTCSGRMGSRVPVAEALMERTMQLHGAARPADDAERTRPMTGGRRQLHEAGASGLSVDAVAALLSRLADLHQHYGAIADGKRDAGDTLGGKLLDELDGALSAMTSACTQSGHSKLSDAAARVQGEARNATLAISTALAIVGSGDGEEMLRLELEKVRGELMSSRMQSEAAKAQSASQVDALNKRLGKKEAEVDALQRQVKDASQGSARQREEEEEAVAMDLMSAAKTTALEAANSELSNEVKQLKAQLQHAKADAKAQMAAAAAAAAAAVGSAGPLQASSQHASSQRPPTAAASAAATRCLVLTVSTYVAMCVCMNICTCICICICVCI
jgi:hypothetical protein